MGTYLNALRIKQLHATYIISRIQNPSQWSHLLKAYLSHARLQRQALYIYTTLTLPIRTHHSILALVLKACSSLSQPSLGQSLHCESIKLGNVHDVVVGTALISMYCKCGSISNARKLFDEMPVKNEVTHNAMIGGYVLNSDIDSAMEIFDHFPNGRTPITWATMIEGFTKMGDTQAARILFDRTPEAMRTVVTWTVMVNCYAVNSDMSAAMDMFDRMPERNVFVWSSMITGFFKKGDVYAARSMFEQITEPNLVNWNSLIAGYTQLGCCEEALRAYRRMQDSGLSPDEFTVASILSACAQMGALDVGKEVHELINKTRIPKNYFVMNGLIDMYAKCGDLDTAWRIFNGMRRRNDSCWNTMISALASHGLSREALGLFARMERPNSVTFLVVLSACTHGGLVDEGLRVFAEMEERGVEHGVEHYGCLVDMLGRAGRVEEAYEVVVRMPVRANEVVWGALLGACRVHMNTDVARMVVRGRNEAEYVVLANIYAAAEKWEEAERVRRRMVENGVRKTPGCSAVLVGM